MKPLQISFNQIGNPELVKTTQTLRPTKDNICYNPLH